jgi:hypothetical protein
MTGSTKSPRHVQPVGRVHSIRLTSPAQFSARMPMNLFRYAPSSLALCAFLLPLAACASGSGSGSGSGASKQVSAATEARMHGKMQFAILMYETNDAWHRMPVAERDILLKKYGLWVRDLKAKGILKEGNPIGRGGVIIATDRRGQPEAAPIDPNARNLTGYFVIEVASAREAEAIAATCPALLHGEVVHLRPIGHE